MPGISWTKEEKDILLEFGNKESSKQLKIRIPHRTLHAIRGKRFAMGIKYVHVHKYDCRPFKMGGYICQRINGKPVHIHRIIMESHIGRELDPAERVHHIDGDKLNNDIDNLYLCKNVSTHGKIHGSFISMFKQLYNDNIISFDTNKEEYVYKSLHQ